MTLHLILFYCLAILTGVSAIAVVVSQNIVRAATWLLFSLAGTAGIYFLLGADFLGATQLLIYVGGTLVLVVFGVMLTAQGPFINMRIGVGEWLIALTVGLLLFGVLTVCLLREKPSSEFTRHHSPGAASRSLTTTSKDLGAALLGDTSVSSEAKMTGPDAVQNRSRTRVAYILPFEIVSVHLLVVLIGAAYLARAKRRRAPLVLSAPTAPTASTQNTTSPAGGGVAHS